MDNLHLGPIFRSLVHKKSRSLLTLSMTILTFSVVVNCLMIIRAQQEELERQSGFDDEHLMYLQLTNFDPAIKERSQVLDRIERDLRILRNIPGVSAAMSTSFLPWRGGGSSATAIRFNEPDMEPIRTQTYAAGPSLAATLGVDRFTGSPLNVGEMELEHPGSDIDNPASVVISRRFAQELFGHQDPLGLLFTLGERSYLRVSGVLEEFYNPYAWNIEEKALFYPGYSGDTDGSTFLVRVDDMLLGSMATVEEALLADSAQRGVRISGIPETRLRLQAAERMTSKALSVVIALMVFITSVSIIGMTMASVASRRREIGTRRALGATRRGILRHFLLENAALTAVGLAIGIAAAYGLNISLVSSLGVPKLSVFWVVIPGILVTLVNVVAAWHPAWQASRVQPSVATKAL